MTTMYHPTQSEIIEALATPWEKWPHLRTRLARAQQILTDFDLHYRPGGGFMVDSQSDGTRAYTVSFDGCNCYDYTRRGAVADGRAFCKHYIAVLAYREIMAAKLAEIEIVPMVGASARAIARHAAPVLMQEHNHAILHGATHARLITIRFRYDHRADRRTFATPEDLAVFADWYAEKLSRIQTHEDAAVDAQAAKLGLDELPAALRRPRTPDQWRAYHDGETWQAAAD